MYIYQEKKDDEVKSLARTGFETAGLLGLALMLVIAGAAIVRRARSGNEN